MMMWSWGTRKKKAGRLLEGRTWDEMPAPSRQDMGMVEFIPITAPL